jgi:hypothetical protein
VTTGTLEEMRGEVLAHPASSPGLTLRDFCLFGPFKPAVGEKLFRARAEVKHFVQNWLDKQPQTLFETAILKVPER